MAATPPSPVTELPAREIPGDYGLPFFGAIQDRFHYFADNRHFEFFNSQIRKYKSTVLRCNMPPGPFMSKNSRVVCLLDAVSFRTLFDSSKVEKKDVLFGTFRPSIAFNGGYRVCAYLDTLEEKHTVIKEIILAILAKNHGTIIPSFLEMVSSVFSDLESDVSAKGKSVFNDHCDDMSFDFVYKFFTGVKPPAIRTSVDKYLVAQLAPLIRFGLPRIVEDLLLRTFHIPAFLVKSDYQKLYSALYRDAQFYLDEAERKGIKRDEACHNLAFTLVLNAYGGFKSFLPALMKWVAIAGKDVQSRLRDEIRGAVARHGVTLAAIAELKLTKSVIYEAMRMEPTVPSQYATARQDLTIANHENTFSVKKGEILLGFQPVAMRDPVVFSNPDEFVADRFTGDGEKLIEYVYWSNGRSVDPPKADNKQCPATDMVNVLSSLMLVQFFLRYDEFEAESKDFLLGSTVTIKSLTKAQSFEAAS